MPKLLSQTLIAFFLAGAFGLYADDAESKVDPLDLFEQRIMPIFKSPQPSSCVQCHLAAVDLKNYILPSSEKTFASLRTQGLIDVDQPAKSKILGLIKMGDKDLDKGAQLIHEKTRQAEYDAFAAWIAACCNNPELLKVSISADEQAAPARANEVIRHARKSRVVDSFVRNIWSQRMRCFPCHTPFELDAANPKHQVPIQRMKELRLKVGEDVAKRLPLFKETPEETLAHWIGQSRDASPERLPMINLDNPRKSLIVLKPTSKLPPKVDGKFAPPSSIEPVSHMGGLKMHVDDQSYKSFVSWIQDYANVVGDKYASVEELPADNWYASKHVLQVRRTPAKWPAMTRVQLFVHAWDKESESWKPEPVAFTQGLVTPRKMMMGALFLLADGKQAAAKDWDPEDATLSPGKYLVKAFLDSQRQLADDPTLMLGRDDFHGQAEIQARWQKGFPNAERVLGDAFK